MFRLILKTGFLSLLVLTSSLAGAAIEVRTDRNPVRVNESFKLIFESDESLDGDPDFSPIRQHFDLLNTSHNSNISIINGEYKRIINWTLQLMPKQAGEFIIPAISFGNDKTRPFKVSVKQTSFSTQPNQEGLIFEMVTDKPSVYVQGQIIVTLRLMSNRNLSRYSMGEPEIQDMDVVVESLGDMKQYQTRISETPYLVLEKKYALFPQQSGKLSIPGVNAEVQLQSPSRSMFDPFQSSGEIRRVRSQALSIEVNPPAAGFSGAHWLPSSYIQLSEEWQGDLQKLVTGEPVTRTIMLLANDLTSAQLPELSQTDIDGIKLYPDKADTQDKLSDTGIVALRQQKIALIPSANGNFELPEIVIPWWNVETEQEEYARLPARTLQVAGAVADTPVSANESGLDNPAKLESPGAVIPTQVGVNSFWMWFSLILACGWIASGLIWWYRDRLSKQQAFRGSPKSQNNLGKARNRLKHACRNHQPQECRESLLDWANALDSGRSFNNLDEVAKHFGIPLKVAINLLNQSLYSAKSCDWNGEMLLNSCAQIEAGLEAESVTNAEGELIPLNP